MQSRRMSLGILLLIIAVIGGVSFLYWQLSTLSNLQESRISALHRLLFDPSCERACWNGIEPGRQEQDAVVSFFDENGIEYTYQPFIDPIQGGAFSFAQGNGSGFRGMITMTENTVGQVLLAAEVCVSRVVQELGSPDGIDIYNNNFSDGGFLFLYAQLGLVFEGRDFNPLKFTAVFFLSETNLAISYSPEAFELKWEDVKERFDQECRDDFS
jgi:hypothetical protein